ncbi:MAG: ParB/RepB/Spo0J family partition protein [Bacteroidales bacterium]|nr:ParB/RepB/Spo0J family partition protein [Bacteroidales bacterium]
MNDNNAPHYTELPIALLEENKGQIDGLPANPRNIQPDKLAKLKRSILDNPEMLQLRGILVYPHGDKYIVIGGNMRLRAMVELGMTTAPCVVIPSHVTADKLTANRQGGQLCAFSYICKRLQSGYVEPTATELFISVDFIDLIVLCKSQTNLE